MMTKLQNPLFAAGFSLLLSLGLGLGLCWRAAAPLFVLAAHTGSNVKKQPAIEKIKGWDFWTIEIENLSNELKGERDRLRKQAELLDQRTVRLANQEKELTKVRTEIEAMRKEIVSRVTEISADEEKNIRSLGQTYSVLTPKAVVAIMREMDDSTSVKILSSMKAEVVGPVFEEMSRTEGTDGPMAARVALLSEKMRQMKSSQAPK